MRRQWGKTSETGGKDNQGIIGGAEEFEGKWEEVTEIGRLQDWTRKDGHRDSMESNRDY